ncbi:MAG: PAS domain S-box protein, partial [Gammaproteobacteria bacterium]
ELPTVWSAFTAAHMHPDEAQARLDALARSAPGEAEFVSREMRLKRKDGRWGWYHGRAAIVRDAQGRPYRLIGSLSDTNERHRREEELAQARQQLQDAIESLEVGIVMFDRDERLVLCNQRFREMYGNTGLAPEPGARLEDLVRAHYAAHPGYRVGVDLDTIVAERARQYRERRGSFEQQRGSRWLQITNNTTADGGVVSLRHDITAIKRTEQALHESEARLRTVFDNSPLGIFLAGTDGAIVFRNRVFARITGTTEREWRKHAWLGHVHEDERAWIGARWYEYVAAATGSFDIEYRTADTPERIVRLRAAPIVEQGQALGFAGTLEDVSAQRQAEIEQHRLQLQLQQAQKMDAIGHLTGGIAHDFNNILASILGYAALAGERRSTQADAKLVTYLDAIRQSGERARELVAKMLAFSRSEPREVVTPTSVQPLIGEAVKLLKAIIPANIHIVTVSEPGLPPVLVDGVDLHQAIVNLSVNARDAIGGHGQITIAVRAPRQLRGQCASCRESFAERYVEIAVSDTGTGIAPEHLPRLFEPFFSTKEVGKGTGMGLAVTHGVVHRVGGHILVETAPGTGTTVRLLLRAAQSLVRAVPATPPAPAAPAPRVARILVVDDEPLVMGLISEVLESHGYAVVGYTDSRQALAWARGPDARFDLLVTDQTMPGLTGVELARELLAMRPMLPVILCTGFSESVDARIAAAMGIRHFFSKPLPLERLLAAVDTLINDGPAPAIVA